MNKTDIKKISDEVIKIQEQTIEKLKINIADDVSNVIEYLAKLDGKIIITGGRSKEQLVDSYNFIKGVLDDVEKFKMIEEINK